MQIKRIFTEIFNNFEAYSATGLDQPPRKQPNKLQDKPSDFMDAPDLVDVDEPMQLLYAYIEAELDGADAVTQFPQVHRIIDTSNEAYQQYIDLKEILVRERDGTLVIPSHIPSFDFSYLQTTPGAVVNNSWQWDTMGRLVVQFSEHLLKLLLPPHPHPQTSSLKSAPAANFRSSDPKPSHGTYQFHQQVETDLVVSIEVKPSEPDSDAANVAMTIDIPSLQGAPMMADSRILLSYPGQEPITQTTDPFGQTTFRNIPHEQLPQLKFIIEPVEVS
ncbi:MAG: hypothetical protein AAF702_23145 [Chloroflexota bacterium]